jgi:phage terminase large subunit-like protein
MWSTACPDWERRLLAGESLVPDLPLFESEAARALRMFKRLRVPDLFGTPTLAEACGEWFFPIVEALFGSYDPDLNKRMIQEYFLLIPKKNAKSSNGGAVMVVALLMNKRPSAEFLLIAPTKEIADIAFKQASGTILLDPTLKKLFHIQRHIRLITHRNNGATLQIKAADTDVITGSKATGTMIDETHVFAKKANAADVFLEIRGALTARPDGFLFQTTTQSKAPPSGVFAAELNMARRVRDGLIDFPMLPILYELPNKISEKNGWKDRKYWPLVNPNMGRSVNEEFLARELLKAEEQGPAAMALLASQHFNVEIGLGLQTDAWAGAEHWEAAGDRKVSFEELIARCDVVVCGIDGGGLDDLLGFAAIGRDRDTRKWLHYAKAWAHKTVLERRKEIAPKILDLVAVGDAVVVDDLGDDIEQLVDMIDEIEVAGLLPEENAIGVDPMGIGQVIDALAERGIDNLGKQRIVGISQGWKLSGAIKTTERKLAEGSIVHGAQPLMAWAVGNAKVEPRGNAITITKQTSGTAKIDPLMATFNAVALMAMNPEPGISVFDQMSEETQSAGEQVPDDDIDQTILRDHAHPRWQEMREKYNDRFLTGDEV